MSEANRHTRKIISAMIDSVMKTHTSDLITPELAPLIQREISSLLEAALPDPYIVKTTANPYSNKIDVVITPRPVIDRLADLCD